MKPEPIVNLVYGLVAMLAGGFGSLLMDGLSALVVLVMVLPAGAVFAIRGARELQKDYDSLKKR